MTLTYRFIIFGNNMLSTVPNIIKELVLVFGSECKTAINSEFVNFKYVFNFNFKYDEGKSGNSNMKVRARNEKEKNRLTWLVKLFGVHIGNKLDFNSHINKLCKPAGNQVDILTHS